MYLNLGTGKNKIIDKINGTNILLYGHVGQRYFERLAATQRLTKINNLRFDKIINRTVQAIKDNYETCITKDGAPVRNTITCNVKVKCDNTIFDVEVAVLVKSTKVEWNNRMPKKVAKDYVEYVNNGELNIGDKVIAIETIAVTIKEEHEETINFTLMNIIGEIKVPQFITNVNQYELFQIVKNIINVPTMRTEFVYNFVNSTKIKA
jgi:hypothetical protein